MSIYYVNTKGVQKYHPVHGRKSLCPKSSRSFAKLYINVYIRTVGSATPSMRRGCPPRIEWMMPQSAVDARVCTAVRAPSVEHNLIKQLLQINSKIPKEHYQLKTILVPVFLSNCSPKEITGIAEAKNMYVVGARILFKITEIRII